MKYLLTCSLVFFMVLTSYHSSAQRLKLTDGNLSALKEEKSINTLFVYENMKVGKFDKEEDYVRNKTADYNKKEPGKGDTWAKNWESDRSARFEPKFNELLEKASGMSIKKDAKYTLIFKTQFTEPGFNIGIMRKNAEINAEAWIVETANQNTVIAKISVQRALGRTFGGYDFDTGERISEAYADAGKALGNYIK
ncbi:MAG: hypothetical protein ABIN89_08275 [Chitinophagaceae bacterium]